MQNVKRYISNCKCARIKVKRDKRPSLLHLLLILARFYQHLTIDFIKCLLNEQSYDSILIIINKLDKKATFIHYYKIIIAKDLANFFLIN
jgi:hypothetical protein